MRKGKKHLLHGGTKPALQGRCCPHFTDGASQAQTVSVSCPQMYSGKVRIQIQLWLDFQTCAFFISHSFVSVNPQLLWLSCCQNVQAVRAKKEMWHYFTENRKHKNSFRDNNIPGTTKLAEIYNLNLTCGTLNYMTKFSLAMWAQFLCGFLILDESCGKPAGKYDLVIVSLGKD